jgi:hypothetical protein
LGNPVPGASLHKDHTAIRQRRLIGIAVSRSGLPIFRRSDIGHRMSTSGLHENLHRPDEVAGPSDRNFGLTFALVFGALGAFSLYHRSGWAVVWTALAAGMLALALARPQVLAGANRAWLKLGLLLNHVVSPVVMAVIFYLVMLPIGLMLRAFRKDLLRLKLDGQTKTYWISRVDSRPQAESMRQQF